MRRFTHKEVDEIANGLRVRLSAAQKRLLTRAVADRSGDGAPFKGYAGRLRSAQLLKAAGLVELVIPGDGRMPRILITDAGRAALANITIEGD